MVVAIFHRSKSSYFTVSYCYRVAYCGFEKIRAKMSTHRQFVDFDANLLHVDLRADHQRLMIQADSVGVKVFVVPGSTLSDSRECLTLSSSHKNVLVTCGVHPYHAESNAFTEAAQESLEEMVKDPLCLAVGECGLDYSDGFPQKNFQIEWFEYQLQLALRHNKPLYFHIRAAHDDFMNILTKYDFVSGTEGSVVAPSVCGVVHCFTGNKEELRTYLSLGFNIGLTGHVINSLSTEVLSEYLQLITLEKLVVETDAPYMGFKGCRSLEDKKKGQKYPNVPSALLQVAQHIATVGGWSVEEVATKTTDNALKIFGVERVDVGL